MRATSEADRRRSERRPAAPGRRPAPTPAPPLRPGPTSPGWPSRPPAPSPTSPRCRSCAARPRRSPTTRSSSTSSATPTTCSAAATATSRASARAWSISADGYVLTNSHVVGEGAGRGHRRPGRQARAARQGGRRRRLDRPGPAQGRRARPADDSLGRLVEAQGGRVGAGHRQPVPAQPDRHAGHRQRARPGQRRHRRLRGLHPDRRRDQPRQLGRRAHQRARRAHRHQHRDLLAERRLPGHRLRGAEQPGAPRRRRPDESTASCGADRSATSRSRRSPRAWPTSCARRPPTAWW